MDFKLLRRHRTASPNGHVDRLPPFSPEAERGVLGCILIDPAKCLPEAMAGLPHGRESFYDLRHQMIYDAAVACGNAPADIIAVHQKLSDGKQIEDAGGMQYLNGLTDATVSASNVSYYADIVREKFILRKAIQVCTDAVARIYEDEGNVDETLDRIERDILAIRKFKSVHPKIGIKELARQALDHIEAMWKRQGQISGLPTGFIDLDKVTDGMHGGDMIVVSAFTSVGKSSLAMNIAEHVLLHAKKPVGVFTLEMTSLQLVTRFICSHARVSLRHVRDGYLTEGDFPKIGNAASRVSGCAIYFDDSSDLSIYQLRANARRMKQQHGIELIIVDYLQLLNATGGNRRVENRQQEVSDISNGIKQMAKELNVPVLALSQLNDDGKLRESRAIGMDADCLWNLEREDSESNGEERSAEPISLWVRKNRNGPRDICVNLTFLCPFTRFESAAKIADEPTRRRHHNDE